MKQEPRVIHRRKFLQIVAFAGATATAWKFGLLGGEQMQMVRRSQPIMGTVLNITVYGPDRDSCEDAVTQTIARMTLLESRLSRHQQDSDLARLNTTGHLANPPKELVRVLEMARDISSKTAGAFDVSMLPLLRMHESLRGSNNHPDQSLLETTKALVNYQDIVLSNDMIRLKKPGMALTLDGIGKGYIVDEGIAVLRSRGFNNVYLEAGGDLMVSGYKDKATPWRIGLRTPRPELAAKPIVISVSDKAVATSGDYMQAFTPDLKNHHIINPHSGFSPPELASCTVTAPNVALADSLATAIMVLGPRDGLDLIESMDGCEALMVDKQLQHINSTAFYG
jgi:thiamine biosynthesis lipoprotein